ncbi:chaplin [Streptomyces sp. NPDC007901]|uniref:chaplin n=1 Tax=Streptomyces sp. NPDC007901 TaxID=3364785 RepID=UPI0036ED922B
MAADAAAVAANSPSVASGLIAQVPVNVPVNASGLSVNIIGLLNPAFGNTAVNK